MADRRDFNIGDLLVFKSNQLMAFNKPPGTPVQSAEATDFHQMAMAYAHRNLFILHRIDQPASGLILFARNAKAAAFVGDQFREHQVERIYYALVKNAPPKKSDALVHHLLRSTNSNKSRVVKSDHPDGRESRMKYEVIAKSDTYHLLKISIETGRHHQIRAQLSAIGCPIKGDVKYGDRRSNPDRSIHLHAYSLKFIHPVSKDESFISSEPPDDVLWNYFRSQLGQ